MGFKEFWKSRNTYRPAFDDRDDPHDQAQLVWAEATKEAEARGYARAIEMLRSEHNKVINAHTVQFNWGADLAASYLEERNPWKR